MKYKRGKKKSKLPNAPRNGSWSRMIHKWWIIDRKDKGKKTLRDNYDT